MGRFTMAIEQQLQLNRVQTIEQLHRCQVV
jgi:hypothetical protein